MILDIVLVILGLFLVGFGVYLNSKSSTKRIELNVDLVPGTVDNVLEHFRTFKKVNVSGILGTDFMEKYGYVVDFHRGIIRHKLYTISFKEAMELLRIPYVVLWQGKEKYIFIVDTGSSNSHISTDAMNRLDFEYDNSERFMTVGAGGNVSAQGIVKAKFYYR